MEKAVVVYCKILGRLNRATVNGIKAPHKPILLLSVIESIAFGEIKENKIEISPFLVARFKDNWNRLVKTDVFKPNFALPFFHMKKEGFWKLQTYYGKEILVTSSHSINSFSQLKEAVSYAYLDSALFSLLQQPTTREEIYQFLMAKYFDHSEKIPDSAAAAVRAGQTRCALPLHAHGTRETSRRRDTLAHSSRRRSTRSSPSTHRARLPT